MKYQFKRMGVSSKGEDDVFEFDDDTGEITGTFHNGVVVKMNLPENESWAATAFVQFIEAFCKGVA